MEMAAAIKAAFEPVIQTSLYPRSQIDIFIQVLQQDGPTADFAGLHQRADTHQCGHTSDRLRMRNDMWRALYIRTLIGSKNCLVCW